MFDLERAHQVADAANRHPLIAFHDAVDQARAECIATAGRIGDAALVGRRNIERLAIDMDLCALRAAGRDVGLDPAGDIRLIPACAFLQQVRFVVIDRDVIGLLDEMAQFLAVEQRHGLARVEDEGNAALTKLAGILQHAVAPIWTDDAKLDAFDVAHVVFVGAHHCAWMEGGDLVVVQIGGDEGLGGEQVGEFLDLAEWNSAFLEMLAIRPEILADGCHGQRISTEQLEVVGDIAGAAAKFTAHARHQEGHIQDMPPPWSAKLGRPCARGWRIQARMRRQTGLATDFNSVFLTANWLACRVSRL